MDIEIKASTARRGWHVAFRPSIAAWLVGVLGLLAMLWWGLLVRAAAPSTQVEATPSNGIETFVATAREAALLASFDGVVEALRQTTIAAQVAGAVVRLDVKAGDRVRAGQLLLQIDSRAAAQSAQAGAAQVQAARAALDVARQDHARQKSLFDARFISAAAYERALAEFRAAEAQAAAQLAQAGVAQTTAGLYAVHAPYAGVVSDVPVTLGDMAMPGRALMTLFDPGALRIAAALPQSAAARLSRNGDGPAAKGEVRAPGAASRWLQPLRVQLLPAADASTHTMTARADLPPGTEGLAPGQFARLWLPMAAAGDAMPGEARATSPWVPVSAIVRRAEMTGLYVLDQRGRPLLRQVRLGREDGERVEVLAGLTVGERVALEGQRALRLAAVAR